MLRTTKPARWETPIKSIAKHSYEHEHRPPSAKAELAKGLQQVLESPKDDGRLEMIVRRPDVDERETLQVGDLDLREGLVGDSWIRRKSSRTTDGSPHPEMQLNVMNSRVIDLLARSEDRWPLAGDQLYVDMDISRENLPPGTRLQVGEALIEITAQPHNGCKKFSARFGLEAMRWVNTPEGKALRLRGLNAQGDRTRNDPGR